jgi:hypothetical protein
MTARIMVADGLACRQQHMPSAARATQRALGEWVRRLAWGLRGAAAATRRNLKRGTAKFRLLRDLKLQSKVEIGRGS